jgi:hypothetical protein
MKTSSDSAGIESATFRLVARILNDLEGKGPGLVEAITYNMSGSVAETSELVCLPTTYQIEL